MAAPTIDALPASPSRNDPSTFSNKADALVAALPGLVTDINAVGTYYNSNALVEYAFGSGTVAAPSIHFQGTTDTGLYLSGGYITFSHDGVASAFIEADGTSVSSANAIITSEKGDARYLKLSGSSMTGNLNLSNNDILNVTRLELLSGAEGSPSVYFSTDTDTGIYFTGTRLAFSNDGAQSAIIEAAGTATSDAQSVITREKGDARYGVQTFSAGVVGTYGLFRKTTTGSRTAGETIAGSNLRYAGVSGGGTAFGATPSGSWRCMGHLGTSTTLVTVFIRYA